MNIENLKVESGSSIRQALKAIDIEGSGICFIVNKKQLVGVMTDGDARRALISGITLEDSVDKVMKRSFFSLEVGANLHEIQKGLLKYKYIPILSDINEMIDLATLGRYHQIPLVQPVFDGNELEYVTDCITSGWISSQGKYVRQFEEDFAKYIGGGKALAVSNGTVALHLALCALGVGPGDEVIVPNLTFVAPVNAVIYVGATPVLVDIDEDTLCMNCESVRSAITQRTKAILPVHLYGNAANMIELSDIADKMGLLLIEDCAEALGTRLGGKHVGLFGGAATFSFFGNKTITTGEGGMVIFNDDNTFDRAKMLRDHGMSVERRYWHTEVGFNYRMTNLQAAIGVAQLQRVDFFVNKKRWIAKIYDDGLKGVVDINRPGEGDGVFNSYWLYTIVLSSRFDGRRDELLEFLKDSGIEARPVFYPVHLMPPYQKYNSDGTNFPISNMASERGVSLPSSIGITEAEVNRVCSVLRMFVDRA